MCKKEPPTGPMETQRAEPGSIMPTQVLPMMPSVGKKLATTPQPERGSTRAEAVRAAKAKIMRRGSLRKQREALKGQSGVPMTR
jgi:hypothetical protein